MRLRHQSIINARAFQENETSGKASLNWQESVENFNQQEFENSKLKLAQDSDTDERSASPQGKVLPTKKINLFLILLPKGGVKHSPIFTKVVQIQSKSFFDCEFVDFLNLCRQIFNESGKLNYIYDQGG